MKKGLLFVIVIFLIAGVGVGTYFLGKNSIEVQECEKNVETEKKDYVFTEKHKNYGDITFNDKEELEKFLNRMNFLSDDEYRVFFLNTDIVNKDFYYEDIANELKLTYVVSQFLTDETAYLFETEFLKKEVEKVFSDGISNDSLDGGWSFTSTLGGTTYSIICNEDICFADYAPGGGTKVSRYESYVYSVTLDTDNTTYLVKEYYYDFDTESVYVEKDGELLFKGNATEENLKTVEDKLNTYEMTFDKDNRYVSSKKIN